MAAISAFDLSNINILDYVLNENNILITKKDVEDILIRFNIKHKIKDLKLFQTALTHSSYMDHDFKDDRLLEIIAKKDIKPIPEEMKVKALPLQKECYERLEFLGDAVLHLINAEYLSKRYDNCDEGFLTKLRTRIEDSDTLAKFTKILGLDKYILFGRSMEQSGGRLSGDKIFEDVFEAFIAALFLDSNSNYQNCYTLVVQLLVDTIDFSQLINKDDNYKALLLQLYHKFKWEDPEYGMKSTIEAGDNKKTFNMYVKGYLEVKGETKWTIVGIGSGSSKKKGEQEAARNALLFYKAISDDDEYEEEVYNEDEINYD
jgi:dsRNA-specific ribonuclease